MRLQRLLALPLPTAAVLLAVTAALLLVWLADVAGPGVPIGISRVAVLLAGVVALIWLVRSATLLARTRPAAAWILLALLVASFGIKLSILDFELTTHARNDEGVYLETSKAINEGDLLPEDFNYGHLVYYAGAVALWISELFPETTAAAAQRVYGARSPFETTRIVVRLLVVCLAALMVIPVFFVADRISGPLAGGLGALLLICSTVLNDLCNQFTSDVPSSFFAALSLMFVARLLDGERTADYLLAGAAAGLAAACKYPGGVVVVAIFGVWLHWRIRTRRWSWSLAWAAAATVAAMLAVMPAIYLTPERVYVGDGKDILFGVRQYAFGGWLGVEPDSVPLWYLGHLRFDFGLAAAIVGLAGWLLLERTQRRRLVAMLPFPLLYLGLLFLMNMAVRRNLLPVLPALAAVLGVGLAAWPTRLGRWRRRGRVLATALLLAVLAHPVIETAALAVRRNRPSTGEQAIEWIRQNVPEGAAFIREDYTPPLRREAYPWVHRRFVARMTIDEVRDPAWDYLLLSQNAYIRFLDPGAWSEPHHELFAARYQEMFRLPLVREFAPSRLRAGAPLRLYRLDPKNPRLRRRRRFDPADAAWVSDPRLRKAGADRLRFTRRWQYALFKEYFAAGAYRARIGYRPDGIEGYLHVVSRENLEVGTFPIDGEPEFELPAGGKYFLKVFLAPPGELTGVEIRPAGGAADRSPA